MINFTTRKTFLVPSFELDVEERENLDKFLLFLEESGVSKFLTLKEDKELEKGGRPSYSRHNLFATILYGFTFNSSSLRDLESSCKYDLRYFYLMEQDRPGHTSFGDFINEVIVPNRREIFHLITSQIIKECELNIDDAFIDGSKFEADANKYKFVWKPTKYHENLSNKIRELLSEVGLSRSIPEKGIIDSKLIASKVSELSKLTKDNILLKKKYDLLREYLAKALDYEEKERICGPDRNSYYKTDHDATAMCLKQDYYSGLGSSMHAAYNTQLLVSKGIICTYYVSQSRNDIKDFIPVLEAFNREFGFYPKRVCADSGYGSLENYEFLNENKIENYVKYFTFAGNVSGKNPDPYYLEDDGTIICLNGNKGFEVKIENRHPKKVDGIFYKIEDCNDCGFKDYCKRYLKNKNEDFKIFEVSQRLTYFKQEAMSNLLSVKGIEMRVNRSSQIEGAFGVLKEDMHYTRLRRTTMENAETELMLTFLGYNLRKLFRHFEGKAKFTYWVAPENLKPEEKKKPSAKRLSNKVNKKKNKSINQQAKENYKYK
ncbi:MAG: transposase [Bacillota bacterium]|nr:transposase [Bacillota bacterium]